MKNKLEDLNNHLFEQLERLNDEELDEEQLKHETKRAQSMVSVSSQIIDTHNIALQIAKSSDNLIPGKQSKLLGLENA